MKREAELYSLLGRERRAVAAQRIKEDRRCDVRIRAAGVLIAMLALVLMGAGLSYAKGPANAGGANRDELWNPMASLYVGEIYWGLPVELEFDDGTAVDPFEPAFVMVKMQIFRNEQHASEEWDSIKYWLDEPVEITFPDGSTDEAVDFIFIRIYYSYTPEWEYRIELQAYH